MMPVRPIVFCSLAGLTLLLTACPEPQSTGQAATLGMTGGGTDSVGDPTEGSGDPTGDGDGICLPHNCESDLECEGCDEDRTTCYLPDKRCVACDPDTGAGCAEGKTCTEFGYCVDEGLTCETDEDGEPTVECNDDPDCAACDPDHQVCSAGSCVQCRGDALDACNGSETCIDNECVPKCPASCTTDADCSECGLAGQPANACHNHKCAECSATVPCPNGEYCTTQGTCAAICGIPGQSTGTCDNDNDCAGCEGDNDNCITPINGGHGQCGPSASGCSDLGNGVVVLPEPFDQVTNACSDDPDCAGIGVQYNVGKLLRELTGIDEIDDAIVEYPMSRCAELTVGSGDQSISCGICVPCEVDSDCMDIDIDEVAGDAFGPLGAIATALLLDQLFGANEHTIHMFCQPVAAGYGACVPCPNLLNDCSIGGGGGGGSGTCDHNVCTAGTPLDPTCSGCAETVCSIDDYCCNTEWDSICVGIVEDHCAGGCEGTQCHDQCEEGEALSPSCNQCVADICDEDPWCCENTWDNICVGHVADICGGQCVGAGCAHDECATGGALIEDCSSCAMDVCALDSFCCSVEWDQQCVDEAADLCGC